MLELGSLNDCSIQKLLTLRTGVHDNFGDEAGEEELDQADGEAEASPVMAVLENLEGVAVELDIAVKVHLLEGLHGDLVLAIVLGLVLGVLEGQVVLNRAAGKLGLLVLPRGIGGDEEPETSEKREINNDGEEDEGLQAAANLVLQIPGDNEEGAEEGEVGEALVAGAVGGQRGILDGRVLEEDAASVRWSIEFGRVSRSKHTLVVRTPQSSHFSKVGGLFSGVFTYSNMALLLPLAVPCSVVDMLGKLLICCSPIWRWTDNRAAKDGVFEVGGEVWWTARPLVGALCTALFISPSLGKGPCSGEELGGPVGWSSWFWGTLGVTGGLRSRGSLARQAGSKQSIQT